MSTPFVFFGTSQFSVTVLDTLEKEGFLPSLMVTQPDRPKGRNLVLTPPPVKEWALSHNIPLLQPSALDSAFTYKLKTINYKLFIVASYGLIIPKEVLDLPEHGALNVHPSLLPKYRGATPIQSAILNGETKTGVTIMLMDEKMDHGPVVRSEKLKVQSEKVTTGELEKELAELGGKMLAEIIPRWVKGEIKAIPQNEAEATYTKKLKKEDGLVDLAEDPELNFRKIRAFQGNIGTYFLAKKDGKDIRVKITKATLEKGKLVIEKVIPENRKESSYDLFLKSVN